MAAEAIGDEPFAVLLPDELMGSSSLLAHMNGVCARTGGSVVALKEVPHDEVSRYGVIAPSGPVDADGVVPVSDLVEKPPIDEAPSDLIIIGRYVLTPDVFEEIAAGRIGALGEIQLTDALRAQAQRSPFHGVVSNVDRFDTGTPFGFLTAAVELGLRDEPPARTSRSVAYPSRSSRVCCAPARDRPRGRPAHGARGLPTAGPGDDPHHRCARPRAGGGRRGW